MRALRLALMLQALWAAPFIGATLGAWHGSQAAWPTVTVYDNVADRPSIRD
jgi:hypothetical protein